MELELALGLPNHIDSSATKSDSGCGEESLLDLNCRCELEKSHGFGGERNCREGLDADCSEAKMLSLMCEDSSIRNQIVGWPPVKSCMNSSQAICCSDQPVKQETSLYVKVNMEGVAIGRKVDLKMHEGYHALINTLANMFGNEQKCIKPQKNGGSDEKCSYTLTYKDKDGDWMLVGDVPWQSPFYYRDLMNTCHEFHKIYTLRTRQGRTHMAYLRMLGETFKDPKEQLLVNVRLAVFQ